MTAYGSRHGCDDHAAAIAPAACAPLARLRHRCIAGGDGTGRGRDEPVVAAGRTPSGPHRGVAERARGAAGRVRQGRDRMDAARPVASARPFARGFRCAGAGDRRCGNPRVAIRGLAAGAFVHRIARARARPHPRTRRRRQLAGARPAGRTAGRRSVLDLRTPRRIATGRREVACRRAGAGHGCRPPARRPAPAGARRPGAGRRARDDAGPCVAAARRAGFPSRQRQRSRLRFREEGGFRRMVVAVS